MNSILAYVPCVLASCLFLVILYNLAKLVVSYFYYSREQHNKEREA